jgi:hypothetical protein
MMKMATDTVKQGMSYAAKPFTFVKDAVVDMNDTVQ